jgi:DNA-directed RNA polymerase specialized sigma24 family protein
LEIEDEKLVGYVFTISMNILIDRERRRKAILMEGGDTDMQIPDTRKGPEYEIETNDLANKVRSLISSFPETDRAVAEKILSLQENEIDLSTARSSAAVRAKWFRLKKRIIKLLRSSHE